MYLPQLACFGLSHRTAPVELRERLVCSLEELRDAQMRDETGRLAQIREFALLSTCNRLELYAAVDGVDENSLAGPRLLRDLLAATTGVEPNVLSEYCYGFGGLSTVEHLARVAAGLESLVLGESEILGQVSRSHVEASEAHTICTVIDAVMLAGIRAGKRVHAETLISRKPVGISSVAVGTAERLLGSLRDRHVLLVGLGEMGTQVLKTLKGRKAPNICLANRTVVRALRLAETHEVTACSLADLPQAIAEADLVISATSAPEAMINLPTVAEAMHDRPNRPLLLIDIAVPRDIDPTVAELDNVHYYDVDHLNRGVDEALTERRREVPKAEAIIGEVCEAFDAELRQLAIEPVVADFRQQAEVMRQQELERTLQYLGPDVDAETIAHIQHLSHALVNKLLHKPTVRLKAHASDGNAEDVLPIFQDIFGLSARNGVVHTNGRAGNDAGPNHIDDHS